MIIPSRLILSGLGLIFLIAFVSYYIQFPGLVSSAGIEPAGRIFPRVFPLLYKKLVDSESKEELVWHDLCSSWVKVDLLCETCCIIGILLSSMVASGIVHHGGLIMFVTFLYYFLVELGGVFYSFQWDTLLLETGFVVSLCLAPWSSSLVVVQVQQESSSSSSSSTTTTSSSTSSSNQVANWPIRFLLFKLMFMSGVVKIQSDCPTWKHLTALEYHFATQCIPGPLAWYVHQMLHPVILRCGVAMTFMIEIPGAFLLLCWKSKVRRIGAWLQILLQILIIFTGNYNFFNVLTILLCLACFDESAKQEEEEKKKIRSVNYELHLCFAFMAWMFTNMFEIKNLPAAAPLAVDAGHHEIQSVSAGGRDDVPQQQSNEWTISLSWTKEYCESMIETTIPVVICYMLLYMLSFLPEILALPNKRRKWKSIFHLLVCFVCIGLSSVPFMNISPGLRDVDNWSMLASQMFVKPWNYIQAFHFSNGYGLFRRMTGVGGSKGSMSTTMMTNHQSNSINSDGSTATSCRPTTTRKGWGGLEPSVVERPEVIFKGKFLRTGTYRELNFRWKPGDVTKGPKQVAPYQPRLDWQMWFAALGSYQHNPWLIHLIHKLLQGCGPVVELLDEPLLAKGDEKLVSIESLLYHYDFSSNLSIAKNISNECDDINQKDEPSHSADESWWIRSDPIREYVPKLVRDDPSLLQYLKAYGYATNTCLSLSDKCNLLQPGSNSMKLCRMVAAIRNVMA
mmetsp:Transcript_8806/g.16625  ORF Transcript_8806/g.16625 Transcript_8806/m.16625 type:complete len:735 (+) Transcript_8806:123-2327(+)